TSESTTEPTGLIATTATAIEPKAPRTTTARAAQKVAARGARKATSDAIARAEVPAPALPRVNRGAPAAAQAAAWVGAAEACSMRPTSAVEAAEAVAVTA